MTPPPKPYHRSYVAILKLRLRLRPPPVLSRTLIGSGPAVALPAAPGESNVLKPELARTQMGLGSALGMRVDVALRQRLDIAIAALRTRSTTDSALDAGKVEDALLKVTDLRETIRLQRPSGPLILPNTEDLLAKSAEKASRQYAAALRTKGFSLVDSPLASFRSVLQRLTAWSHGLSFRAGRERRQRQAPMVPYSSI